MKLCIDSTNNKFIIATIDKKTVVSFEMKETDNNVAKNANKWTQDFLAKSNLTLNDITGFYVSVGPGSFTGVKVGINIVNTAAMVNEITDLNIISSLKLQKLAGIRYSILTFGKGKMYVQDTKYPFKSFKTSSKMPKGPKRIDYEGFDADELQSKLKWFKKVKSIEAIYPKMKYN